MQKGITAMQIMALKLALENTRKQQIWDASHFRTGTPMRQRKGKHREQGPTRGYFEPATIHMLVRSVNKGYRYAA